MFGKHEYIEAELTEDRLTELNNIMFSSTDEEHDFLSEVNEKLVELNFDEVD